MRLLTVVTEAPPIRSGIAEVTSQITGGLRELGHEVDLCTVDDVGRRQFGEVRLTGLAARWPKLREQIAEYDVVNLHGPAPTFSDVFLALWRTIPRRERPALVYTHHSEIELGSARMLCAAYNRLHSLLVRAAHHVIVTTESYRTLVTAAGARRVAVVPLGVRGGPVVLDPSGKAPVFTVAFVGQLRPYKGVDVLLRAAAQLPDVRFEIAGSGHQEPALRALAQKLGLRNVRWLGAVSDAQREALLRRAHVIALPSLTRAEAFGIVLLEGMRTGAVPVASNLPGVRDVAGRSGLLCTPGDPRSLLQAICYLRDDPASWQQRSRHSQELALQYRWDEAALRYHQVFSETVIRRHLTRAVDPTLAPSMELIRQAALSDRATLMLLDQAEQSLRLAAISGACLPTEARLEAVPLGQGFAGRAMATGEPFIISSDRMVLGERRRPDIRTALCVPFSVFDGDVQGVVNFSRMRLRDFVDSEVSWASRQVVDVAARLLHPRSEVAQGLEVAMAAA